MSAYARDRVALVIGNGNYRVNPLSNPVNDARDMAKVLRDLGFDVTLKVNADQMTMESVIDAFGKKLRQNAKAVGLFYFSGHGAQYAGENYLIPINSIPRTSAAAHLRYKAVPAGYVLGVMPGNGLNIVILDACRDNPFKGFSKSLRQGLARMANAEGSLVAYATAPGTVAWVGKAGERNSPYTKHLLRFMKQPNLSIESVLKKVRRAVIRETRHKSTVQKPWYEASISDDFYFVEGFQTPTAPVTQQLAKEEQKHNRITRMEIIDKAKKYANYRFCVSDENITDGKYLGGKKVITPISRPGCYTGIPYKWGGNDSIESFQRGLDAGKKVGDKCAKRCSGVYVASSKTVGVDTSGFISQVWGLERKYSTRNLPSLSTRLRSMNELRPGDILNNSGRHVRLFSHRDKRDRFCVYEASSRGWKVAMRCYHSSQLSKYKPYRYKNVVD